MINKRSTNIKLKLILNDKTSISIREKLEFFELYIKTWIENYLHILRLSSPTYKKCFPISNVRFVTLGLQKLLWKTLGRIPNKSFTVERAATKDVKEQGNNLMPNADVTNFLDCPQKLPFKSSSCPVPSFPEVGILTQIS